MANKQLKFTPLEFETQMATDIKLSPQLLKFTPLEFETLFRILRKQT